MLERAFSVQEIEQLILHNRSTQARAKLRALKGLREPWRGRQGRGQRTVPEKLEGFAVKRVGPRTRGHVHRARCSQLRGKIQARLAQLELLDAARGNVR